MTPPHCTGPSTTCGFLGGWEGAAGLTTTLDFAHSATLGPHRHCSRGWTPHPHLLLLHLQEVLLQEEEEQEGEGQRHEERHEHEGHEVRQPGDVLLGCLAKQPLWLSYGLCQDTHRSGSRLGWSCQDPGWSQDLRQQHCPFPVSGGPDGPGSSWPGPANASPEPGNVDLIPCVSHLPLGQTHFSEPLAERGRTPGQNS